MKTFRFHVSPKVFQDFPDAKFAAVVVSDIKQLPDTDNSAKSFNNFQNFVLEQLNRRGHNILKDPKITSWNKFFSERVTPDLDAAHVALVKRVLKQGSFPQINKLVDIYNTFSVYNLLPVGGHDISNNPEIRIDKTIGTEIFQTMNSEETITVGPNELAYINNRNQILTRHMVWRQSDFSKITDNTTEFFLPLDDIFDLFTREELISTANVFISILHNFYSFKFKIYLIDKFNPEIIFNHDQLLEPLREKSENLRILQKPALVKTDPLKIERFFDHKLDQVYPTTKSLREALLSGKRLRFYIGADATGPRLHIGHLIPVLKMRQLQKLGHEIIFLVGDFTARLGDPTDKSEVRKILSEEEVNENAKKFKEQISRYIDFESEDNPAQLKFNSEWNSKLTLSDVIDLASNTTVSQMLERDMFEERHKNNKPIFLHEFLYPLIQGYDSVYMEVDGEFGGRDQTFNMLMGRTLLKNYKNIDKFVITTHFLLSSDGQNKMSKSIGNCIFIDDSPNDKFGKVMSIPDSLISHYYKLATDKTLHEIEIIEQELEKTSDPMQIKKQLAYEIVRLNDGEEEAKKALDFFEKTVQNNEAPDDAPKFSKSHLGSNEITLKDLVAKTGSQTNAEAKRLIRAGAIELNGVVETDPNKSVRVENLKHVKIGKKNWIIFID